jgi:VTC domain
VTDPGAPPTVVVSALRTGVRPLPPPVPRSVPRPAAPVRVSTATATVKIAAHRPSPRPLAGPVSRPAPVVPSPPAERAVAAAAAGVPGIGLDELLALAELQTRVDRKYFVPAEVFQRVIAELGEGLKVLHIDGRRTFGYESVYFDTPQLTTYKAHVQRRRQRFKARTRTYTDTGLCMFEVKLTGARGETVKERIKHPAELRNVLTPDALRHLHTTLRQAYGHGLPPGLAPVLTTTYRRVTFVSRAGDVRLTCDVGLICRNGRHQVRDTGTHVLVESKSAGQDSGPDEILRELGIRPASVSKYCVGIGALHPDLPSNQWHRTLRRYFGRLTPVT